MNDLVTFEGKSVSALERAFRASVDDYLDTCASLGRAPERTYRGNIALRLGPDLHRRVAIAAEASGARSVNAFIANLLERETTG